MDTEALSLLSRGLNTVVALGLIPLGLALRRRRRLHVPIMSLCFALDLINVAIVEFFLARRMSPAGAGAVEQGLEIMRHVDVKMIHVLTSVLCLAGYGVAIFTGRRILSRSVGWKAHRWNAGVFLVVRLVSYVTSFWM